jgi:ABC-type glycerol-3-phosphate transport system substrate-binding protein
MIMLRTLAIAGLLASLALTACGGGGSGSSPSPYGAATPTQAPAAGTNKPATSSDPYADYGY